MPVDDLRVDIFDAQPSLEIIPNSQPSSPVHERSMPNRPHSESHVVTASSSSTAAVNSKVASKLNSIKREIIEDDSTMTRDLQQGFLDVKQDHGDQDTEPDLFERGQDDREDDDQDEQDTGTRSRSSLKGSTTVKATRGEKSARARASRGKARGTRGGRGGRGRGTAKAARGTAARTSGAAASRRGAGSATASPGPSNLGGRRNTADRQDSTDDMNEGTDNPDESGNGTATGRRGLGGRSGRSSHANSPAPGHPTYAAQPALPYNAAAAAFPRAERTTSLAPTPLVPRDQLAVAFTSYQPPHGSDSEEDDFQRAFATRRKGKGRAAFAQQQQLQQQQQQREVRQRMQQHGGLDNDDDEADDRLYCVCQTLYDAEKNMIACDKCESWFHTGCVRIPDDRLQLVDQFICPRCEKPGTTDVTTWKTRCAHPTCLKPVNPLSKYCSDWCGTEVAATRLELCGYDPEYFYPRVRHARRRLAQTIPATTHAEPGAPARDPLPTTPQLAQVGNTSVMDEEALELQRVEDDRLREALVDQLRQCRIRTGRLKADLGLVGGRARYLELAVRRWERLCYETAERLRLEAEAEAEAEADESVAQDESDQEDVEGGAAQEDKSDDKEAAAAVAMDADGEATPGDGEEGRDQSAEPGAGDGESTVMMEVDDAEDLAPDDTSSTTKRGEGGRRGSRGGRSRGGRARARGRGNRANAAGQRQQADAEASGPAVSAAPVRSHQRKAQGAGPTSLPEAPCGLDARLVLDAAEWRAWTETEQGQAMLRRADAIIAEKEQGGNVTVSVTPNGDPGRDTPDGDAAGGNDHQAEEKEEEEDEEGVCMRPRKKCDRHTGWQRIRAADYAVEKSVITRRIESLEKQQRRLVRQLEALRASIEIREECIERYGASEPICIEEEVHRRLAEAHQRQQMQIEEAEQQQQLDHTLSSRRGASKYHGHNEEMYGEVAGHQETMMHGEGSAAAVGPGGAANRTRDGSAYPTYGRGRGPSATTQSRKSTIATIEMADLLELLVDEHRADVAAQETRLGKQERRAEEREARERRREEAVERDRIEKAQRKAARVAAAQQQQALAREEASETGNADAEGDDDVARDGSPELGIADTTTAMDVDDGGVMEEEGRQVYSVPDDVVQFLSRSEQAKLRMQG